MLQYLVSLVLYDVVSVCPVCSHILDRFVHVPVSVSQTPNPLMRDEQGETTRLERYIVLRYVRTVVF